jgi:hypothetical protein
MGKKLNQIEDQLIKSQNEYIQELKNMIELKDKYVNVLERQLDIQDRHIIRQETIINEMNQSIKTLVGDYNRLQSYKTK